ncbi:MULTISPECIES: RNA polymerase factor sigma-54 [Roseateles]|uniref:RNA polymerase sigma-54 factor n=1 Tax=Pelomonas aquatica TaxID=431058 RepID=A0ABU1ZDN8_9BURK|nr:MULTISPECIES: RNA polymerase factor sigma-54 [Roseateles]KQY88863.1 RNA polymerase sigma-54 factor [Pelomonas sp. Root1444]MDR7297801.1 RNA polymerase sigma-54 factor [Pelomonas aquatica]
MNSLDLRTEHRQTQTLSPRLQHAVRLLQMSSLDFAAMLRDTLGKNPFLEVDDIESHDGADGAEPSAPLNDGAVASSHLEAVTADGAAELQVPADDVAGPPDQGDGESDRDLWTADGSTGLKRAEDGELSALDMMAVETSLTSHLHGQLNVLPLSDRDLALAHLIVESLDDDGYLRTPLQELAEVAELDPEPDLQEMQIALKRVQSLDPAGVAARDVGECLLLQLPAITCPDMRGLAQSIISDHLPALAARDVAGLARQLGESPARIEAVCERIRRLDPRPGWRYGSSQVPYVVPDVIVKKVRGKWTVQLNPAIVPKVRLNQVYAKLYQRHRTAANSELGVHLQEARWTLRNVEQRFSTILDVAEAIVKRQHNFLDYGAMAMKPLGLKEIAEECGIHESTVSRVTNNKYIATPVGVLELKYFFSRAMISANGSACSGTAIRGLIKDIIESENPEAPLSDAEITRQLAQQGLVIARRTVTKYRQMLKIESVDRRRRVAA